MVLVSYYGDGCFLICLPSWKINIAFPFSPAVCIGSVQQNRRGAATLQKKVSKNRENR
jgi:hypothetical protein